jgi:phosphate-selective porin OprO/OprP
LGYNTQVGTSFFKTYSGTTGTNPATDIYAVRQDGNRLRAGWDAGGLFGPVKFISELDVMNTELTREVGRGPGNAPIFDSGHIPTMAWYVQTSWLLTGEDAVMKMPKPKKNFDPQKGTWGAFELAARYSRLEIGSAMFENHPGDLTPTFAAAGSTNRASEITLGLNWYLNPNVKLMFDWEHTIFDGDIIVSPTSGIGSKKSLDDEDAFLFRTQIVW